MSKIESIITGIVSDKNYRMSVREAQKLSKIFQAKVYPVHVIEALQIKPFQPDPTGEQLQRKEDELRGEISRLYHGEESECMEPPLVMVGEACKEIVHVAEKSKNPLIVIGRNNHGVMHRISLTRAERIIKMATGPVWVHPHRQVSSIPKRIVCALDFSEICLRAAEMAISVAKASKAEIHFIHAIPCLSSYAEIEGYTPFHEPDHQQILDNVELRFQDFLAKLSLRDIHSQHSTRIGESCEQINQLCQEIDADLLVLGSSSHNNLERFFLGSTMRTLLNEHDGDILVVK